MVTHLLPLIYTGAMWHVPCGKSPVAALELHSCPAVTHLLPLIYTGVMCPVVNHLLPLIYTGDLCPIPCGHSPVALDLHSFPVHYHSPGVTQVIHALWSLTCYP